MCEFESKEYVTFTVKASDGREVELAVVDEFDFENKHYVAGALIVDDTVDDSGVYIYRAVMKGDDFVTEKITREFEYKKVAEAYTEMLNEEAEKTQA